MTSVNNTSQPQRPYVGAHLLVIKDGKVLLMKRNKGQMKGYYAMVAGKVDQFESPATALIRETKEEAGITIKPENLSFMSVFHRRNTFYKETQNDIVEFIFYADQWDGDVKNMEPHLCDEIGFYDMDNLPDTVTETVKTALNCYQTKQPYFEFKN